MTCKSMVVVQWTFRENGAHQTIYTALAKAKTLYKVFGQSTILQ